MIDLIDRILTVLFWLPAKLIGYEKCSRCTIRYRRIQFLYYLSLPFSSIPMVRSKRLLWELRINPPSKSELKRVVLQEN